MANNYADRTHCSLGHEFTKENTLFRADKGRRCKTCRRASQARTRARRLADPIKRAAYQERDRLLKAKLRAIQRGEDDLAHKNDEKKTAAWNLLAVRQEAMPDWTEFKAELDERRTPCYRKPADFSDFNDPRYPDDPLEQQGNPFPSAQEAEEMCEECPLRIQALCLRFALKQREDFGVYGGKRIVGGKVYGEKGSNYA